MDAKQVHAIYEEISSKNFLIELDPDPQGRGPTYLQERIYECRKRLNRVSFILNQVHQEQHTLAARLRAEEAVFQAESDELLANDERIRRLPAIDDRKATVNVELRERVQTIEGLKAEILDLSHVEKVVKHRHQELKSTMTDIRTQRSLIRDTLDTGQYYGTEDTGNEAAGIGVHDDDDEDFAALLEQQMAEDDGEGSAAEDDKPVVDEDGEIIDYEDEEESTEEESDSIVEDSSDDDDDVVEIEEVIEPAPQDVVVSKDEDPNDEEDDEERQMQAFLDGDVDDDLKAILDQI